jgi:hypothetical protein
MGKPMLRPLEIIMSKKEPKDSKSMSVQASVENLFHPRTSVAAKKPKEAEKKSGKKR